MVAGDICEPAAGDRSDFPSRELPESNGSAEAWLKPVDCADDDFDEVSD